MEHHHPSDTEIRDRILQVTDKQYRMAYMYQYEIVGRIAEVAGRYMPSRDDHVLIEVEGEEFVLFIVKTAKRKARLRPCARPLDTKYDPWAKQLLEYIESGDEHPFLFHDNVETSKTYAMNHARDMFKGLYWPMIDYTRTSERPYADDMVKATRWGDDGYEEYLVVFPDNMRSWTKSKDIVKFSVKVEERWKRATSHVIRKRATLTAVNDYLLDGVSVSYLGGWTLSSQHNGTPPALKHYMHMDLRESRDALPQLEKQARRYAKNFLVKYVTFLNS